MDTGMFHALTRVFAREPGSRRSAVRLLVAVVSSSLVTRHAVHESAAAGKKHKKKKGRRKDKNKDKEKPGTSPLPPGCQNCSECEMCQDDACVPDPALNGVHCGDPQHPQAGCQVCRNGTCVSQCHYEYSICCRGECLLPCDLSQRINPETCQCEDAVCEGPQPNCGVCAAPKCTAGGWICHQFSGGGVDCGTSTVCCATSHPMYSCRGGMCCLEVSEGIFQCF